MEELRNCEPYLRREIELLSPTVIVCLGRIAFEAVIRLHSLRPSDYRFAHGASHEIPVGKGRDQRWVLCSYHPSQQNTLTGRLTGPMFDGVWEHARKLAQNADQSSPR